MRKWMLTIMAVVTLMTGCGQPGQEVPQATSRCGDVTFPPMQSGSHLIGDAAAPIPYSSTPPTSGWHRSGPPPQGVFAKPLSDPAQVATLEAGGVVVTYNGLAEGDQQQLTAVMDTAIEDQIALTPYPAILPGEVVFTSWGAMQRCDGVDVQALQSYVEVYGTAITGHR